MADLIRIKGSNATAVPPTLAARELAYSEASGNLFIGRIADGTPIVIGGKAVVDKLATIAEGAQVNTVDSVAGLGGAITAEDLADKFELGMLNDVFTPAPSTGHVLMFDETNDRWEAHALPSGVTAFTELNDTPNSYASTGGFIVKVNAGATGLEFVDGIDGGTY